jgi:isoquinoline 1-oxidoreductase beta subunit
LAVDKSGYGKKPLPAGRALGVAVHESFDSVVAYVVEASVIDGQPVPTLRPWKRKCRAPR